MHYLVQIYQAIPADIWALLLGALGASALQQKIKNWLELENPKVLVLLTTTFSLAAAVIPSALGWLSANPQALGENTAVFFTGMTLAYRYVIQPSSSKLNSFKSDVDKYKAFKGRSAAMADGVSPQPPVTVMLGPTPVSPPQVTITGTDTVIPTDFAG